MPLQVVGRPTQERRIILEAAQPNVLPVVDQAPHAIPAADVHRMTVEQGQGVGVIGRPPSGPRIAAPADGTDAPLLPKQEVQLIW